MTGYALWLMTTFPDPSPEHLQKAKELIWQRARNEIGDLEEQDFYHFLESGAEVQEDVFSSAVLVASEEADERDNTFLFRYHNNPDQVYCVNDEQLGMAVSPQWLEDNPGGLRAYFNQPYPVQVWNAKMGDGHNYWCFRERLYRTTEEIDKTNARIQIRSLLQGRPKDTQVIEQPDGNRTTWLAPDLEFEYMSDRAVLSLDDVGARGYQPHVATYRSTVGNLQQTLFTMADLSIPVFIEREAIFADGLVVAVKVPAQRDYYNRPRFPWRPACSLVWFDSRLWWADESATPEQCVAEIQRRMTPYRPS